jgi:DNA-directed RNA polymerase
VDIYKEDRLLKLKAEIATYAPHVVVDDPPPRGSFDIEQVLDAPYFFS